MKLRYPVILTVIILLVVTSIGLYNKSLYKDYNKMDNALEEHFAVSLIQDDALERQIKYLTENLDKSNIIV